MTFILCHGRDKHTPKSTAQVSTISFMLFEAQTSDTKIYVYNPIIRGACQPTHSKEFIGLFNPTTVGFSMPRGMSGVSTVNN